MKLVVLLCCVFAVSFASNVNLKHVAELISDRQGRAFEAQLEAAVEKFREIVINGDPALGIPVLDPLNTEELQLHAAASDNDIDLDVLGVRMVGLKDFVVEKLSINVLRFRLDYAFTLPILEMTANSYDLEAHAMGSHLFGNGKARIAITNIKVSGYSTVSIKNGAITMKEFKLILGIDEFQSDIQGLLGGGETSDFINEVLSTLVPSVLESKQQQITDFIEEKVVSFVNGILSGSTPSEAMIILENIKYNSGAFLKQLLSL